MANFASVADVAAFLQVEISTPGQVAACEWALTEASAAVRAYCRQMIELVEDDEITLDYRIYGSNRLLLPELPVVEVASIVENGVTLTEGDYKLGSNGILHRVGSYWYYGVQTIAIKYSHGYDPIPDMIVAVTVRAASRAFQAGLRAADADGVLGVQSKSLGDFSVAYTADAASGEGSMGVSAARMLLLSEKEMLNPYRI
jgi:hypothetical protein